MAATTEFIHFSLLENIKPEDPGNDLGKQFLEILRLAKGKVGHVVSAWSRTEEDLNAVVWVIEWLDDTQTVETEPLRPLTMRLPGIIKVRTRLTPSLSSLGGPAASPVADVTTFPFASDMTEEEKLATVDALNGMRHGALNKLATELRPAYWSGSTAETYPTLDHQDSPTGKTTASIAVVGWQSSAQHYAVWKVEDFQKVVKPVKTRMLSYPPNLGMKHVSFKVL